MRIESGAEPFVRRREGAKNAGIIAFRRLVISASWPAGLPGGGPITLLARLELLEPTSGCAQIQACDTLSTCPDYFEGIRGSCV
jgi:hypothetical protein